ncbi:MAG: 1-acyl-sn-glycerol-3-phosphate acyltransferase [Bacteroidales bacterium]|nr:1-acyl-sn-glycerol-3-phosphate acyltransferase [Bacteroidales bacterium]
MALISIEELERVSPLFRGKCGNAFARRVLHLLKLDAIEELNERCSIHKGAEFARAVIEAVGAAYSVNGLPRDEALEEFRIPEGPLITISNHPIGSLDGLALIDFIGHLRDDYKFMVNELLSRFESLRGSLISVNPNGKLLSAPTATSISGVRQAKLHLEAGGCLGLFPSGAVSDLKLGPRPVIPGPTGNPPHTEPRVRDREWQTGIIKFIRNAGVPVLPIRLLDGNSAFYYNLGLIDWRVRLLRLPSEMLNKNGKPLRFITGPVIEAARISSFPDLDSLRQALRASVYSLG